MHTNILIISNFTLLFFSLFSICKTNALSPASSSFFLWYTLPHKQNQRSTTKIKNQPHPKKKKKKSTTKSITKSTTNTTKSNTPTHGHTNKDTKSGSALMANQRLWIDEYRCLDRHLWIGEYWWLDRWATVKERSFREKSSSGNGESHEWRERVWDKIIKKVRKMIF